MNIARIKVLAFVLAAFFAGIAGGLFAHESGVIISPKDAGFQRSFDYLIMTVLGGRGSISGVMLAAVLLTALPELLRDFEAVSPDCLCVAADRDDDRAAAGAVRHARDLGLLAAPRRTGSAERHAMTPQPERDHRPAAPRFGRRSAAGGRRAESLVRRPEGGAEFFAAAAIAGAVRLDRAQRRGKDDRVQSAHRRLSARQRADRARDRKPVGPQAARDHRRRNRPHVSEHPPVPEHERARQRAAGRPMPRPAAAGGHDAAVRRILRRRRRFASMHSSCWTCSTCGRGPAKRPVA